MTDTELKKLHPIESQAWSNMRQRCLNKNNASYQDYGGRGITVCRKWLSSFAAFYEDMGERPGPGYSINRIDNDGGYEPGNCEWATSAAQRNNQRPRRSQEGHKIVDAEEFVLKWIEAYKGGHNLSWIARELCMTLPGASYRAKSLILQGVELPNLKQGRMAKTSAMIKRGLES